MSFAGIDCVLCGQRPSLPRGERTQSLWVPEDDFLGASLTTADPLVGTTIPVCLRCSGTLAERFDHAARPAVEGLRRGELRLRPPPARAFAQWVLKTWLLTGHPAVQASDPRSSQARFDLSEAPQELYGWLVEEKPPPAGLSVWATRGAQAATNGSPRYRIPLPTVTADGRTTRFQELAFRLDLVDGGVLDIELVYHPGWEIEHPLERESRAMRLWPRDGRRVLDLGALPVLEAHELSWGRGPRLVFAPESYNGEQRAPLSAETSFSFFPPFPPGVTAVFAPGE
ncbi:MAG TPA: hypothetical protein VL264_08255 [Gaiella sp.]|nr:hypothetical protein [Gaiella sp.]